MFKQIRWKSKVMWAAIAAQLLALGVTTGIIDVGMSNAVQTFVTALLEVLAIFGVVNDPTNPDGL